MTVAGTILVADAAAPTRPVFASTHPEWVAHAFLDAPTFPLLATRVLSYFAPEATQAAYERIEPTLQAVTPSLFHRAAVAMPAALPLGLVAADAFFALGTLAYALTLPLGLAGAAWLLKEARKQ